jgi:hypothetical protein
MVQELELELVKRSYSNLNKQIFFLCVITNGFENLKYKEIFTNDNKRLLLMIIFFVFLRVKLKIARGGHPQIMRVNYYIYTYG